MQNNKALFVTNLNDLKSEIAGGVQICSQYFLDIIKQKFEVEIFPVAISRKTIHRTLRKLRIDAYNLYDPRDYTSALISKIKDDSINVVFFNKSELIRFSRPLRIHFGNRIKIIVLSHGNETGDFIHDVVLEKVGKGFISKIIENYRLGINLSTEGYFRRFFIDLVCTMSATEYHIEKWLGAKKTFIIPQIVGEDPPVFWKAEKGRAGFVGTLNHTPNFEALKAILETLKNKQVDNLTIEIVGGPEDVGLRLEKEFLHAKYLGRLSDEDLNKAMSNWSIFLNPIFWYSRGASMKLSKAIAYEIPIITTEAGRRGYFWTEGHLLETRNEVLDFVDALVSVSNQPEQLTALKDEVVKVKNSSKNAAEIAEELYREISALS